MFRVAASPVGRRQALSPSAPDPLAVRAVSVARRVGPSSSQPRPSCPQSLSPSTAESSPLSHVIPPRLFQTLNSQRWNCNVLRRSRKVTVGNYVRGYSVRSGGIFGKCDALNVSEPTEDSTIARGYPCRRVVSWAYLQVNHDITTPSGIRRNLSETCRG